ncbi:hypothetical protein EMCRGX_G019401 [Ephydatia muelleri]
MVKDFRLELFQPSGQAVYITPGEVTGNVVVVTDEPKAYNAISITLRGYADVHWSETYTTGSGNNRRTHTRHYHSHEDYINDVIVLWNQEQIPNRVLNPGQHVLPFRFVMSSGRLPSSFAGPHGHIRYTVEARISTGLFHFDKTVSAIIQVVDRVDINVPALMSPVQYEDEKTICCLCCASPPISLTVNVPRTGFCIGEGIPLTASLDNGSGRIITLRATVSKVVTFHAQGRTRTSSQLLNSFQSPPVQGHTTFQWTPTEQLAIPSAIPTIANCGIIRLQYVLLIEAVIPWAINASINIPITLGNIPPQAPVGPLPPIQYPSVPTDAFVPYDPNSNAAQVPPPGQYQTSPLQPSAGQYESPPPYQAPPSGPYQSPPPGS